jgi:acyl carrier protein|tara:strand:+ start:671 stop:916 length:246 start_codon:yes stop_codon:yes gene_type:complete
MNKKELRIKLKDIFQNIFEDDKIELTDDLSAKDVDNWDSLTHMILITEIEEKFEIKFSLKDLNQLENVGDLIRIISIKTEK